MQSDWTRMQPTSNGFLANVPQAGAQPTTSMLGNPILDEYHFEAQFFRHGPDQLSSPNFEDFITESPFQGGGQLATNQPFQGLAFYDLFLPQLHIEQLKETDIRPPAGPPSLASIDRSITSAILPPNEPPSPVSIDGRVTDTKATHSSPYRSGESFEAQQTNPPAAPQQQTAKNAKVIEPRKPRRKKAARESKRQPSSATERKYRDKLNAEISELRAVVLNRPRYRKENTSVRVAKRTIFANAIQYIRQLEEQNNQLKHQVVGLGGFYQA